jgi:hypothetical protein
MCDAMEAPDVLREPRTVVVEAIDLWAMQKAIKFNTFMLDPRNGQPMFPATIEKLPDGGVMTVHTSWKLRRKVNALLGRFAAEGLTKAILPLDYDECWYIDNVIGPEAYKSAQRLLLQIFQCVWEHENNLSLQTSVMNEQTVGADGRFDINQLIEYLSQSKDKTGWFPKDDDAGSETSV